MWDIGEGQSGMLLVLLVSKGFENPLCPHLDRLREVQGSLLWHCHLPTHKPLPVCRTLAMAPPLTRILCWNNFSQPLSLLPGLPVHVLVKPSFGRNPNVRWTRIPALLSHPPPYLIRFPLLPHLGMSDHPGLSAVRILLGRFSRNPQTPDFSLPNLPCTDSHLISRREFPRVCFCCCLFVYLFVCKQRSQFYLWTPNLGQTLTLQELRPSGPSLAWLGSLSCSAQECPSIWKLTLECLVHSCPWVQKELREHHCSCRTRNKFCLKTDVLEGQVPSTCWSWFC